MKSWFILTNGAELIETNKVAMKNLDYKLRISLKIVSGVERSAIPDTI